MSLYESKLQTLFSVPTAISTTQRNSPLESPIQSLSTSTISSFPIKSSSISSFVLSGSFSPQEQSNNQSVYFSSTEPNQLPPSDRNYEYSTFIPFNTNSITTDPITQDIITTELETFINSTSPGIIDETSVFFNTTTQIISISENTTTTTTFFVTLEAHPYTFDLLLFPLFLISLISFFINILSLHLVLNDYNLSIRKHPTNSTIISLSLSNILGIIFLGFVTILPHKICLLQAFIETFYSSVCLFTLCFISLDRVAATRNVLYYNRTLKDTFIHSMLLVWIVSALVSLMDVNLLGVEKVFITTNSFVCFTKSHYLHIYKVIPILSISCSCIYLLVKVKGKSSTIGIRVMHEPYNTRYPIDNLFTLRKFRVPANKPHQQDNKVTLNYVLICSLYLALHIPTLVNFIIKLIPPTSSSTDISLNYISTLFELISCSIPLTNYLLRPDFKQALHTFISYE